MLSLVGQLGPGSSVKVRGDAVTAWRGLQVLRLDMKRMGAVRVRVRYIQIGDALNPLARCFFLANSLSIDAADGFDRGSLPPAVCPSFR